MAHTRTMIEEIFLVRKEKGSAAERCLQVKTRLLSWRPTRMSRTGIMRRLQVWDSATTEALKWISQMPERPQSTAIAWNPATKSHVVHKNGAH
jgi:hypothetical protein